MLRLVIVRGLLWSKGLFCTGHFVMVSLNLTLSSLFATFFFERLFNFFYIDSQLTHTFLGQPFMRARCPNLCQRPNTTV